MELSMQRYIEQSTSHLEGRVLVGYVAWLALEHVGRGAARPGQSGPER